MATLTSVPLFVVLTPFCVSDEEAEQNGLRAEPHSRRQRVPSEDELEEDSEFECLSSQSAIRYVRFGCVMCASGVCRGGEAWPR